MRTRLPAGRPSPRRGVMVLGMHRSGTSAVTAAVSRLGLVPPRRQDALRGPWNPKGHYESNLLDTLDDQLLEEMDRTWWYPPPSGAAYWETAGKIRTSPRRGRKVFEEAYPTGHWVWKDPRACLLVPFWRQALGDDVAAIVVVRHPLDVAASLTNRNETSTAFGLALWERYNRVLLGHLRDMAVWVTHFDELVADPRQWSEQAAAFLRGVGLPSAQQADSEQLASPVDPQLRHSVHSPADLAMARPATLDLYDVLAGTSGQWPGFQPPELGEEGPEVQAELDRLGPRTPPAWRPPPWVPEPAWSRES